MKTKLALLAIVLAALLGGCGVAHPVTAQHERERSEDAITAGVCQYSRSTAEAAGNADELETYEVLCE